jgi:hypothetical protein
MQKACCGCSQMAALLRDNQDKWFVDPENQITS